MSHDDFDTEPIPGLPARPPVGENILWQGSPHWPTVARRSLHVDLVCAYFAAVLAWRMASGYAKGLGAMQLATSAAQFSLLAAAAVGILALIAWGIGRTTIYTITTERVVLRFGIALPITINVPFRSIEAVDVRKLRGGRGNIAIRHRQGTNIAYLVLWPHARPWRLSATEPMLLALPEVDSVAATLAKALAAQPDRNASKQKKTISLPQAALAATPQPALVAAE
ncbi:MAG: PH domain-containing protein [Proteobacteria bacterium]|nr:PH domain-containing protein [Pseudomonadota bacterium]